jgi:tRNA (cytidine/uridine-2'-O-)-methyltransferase
MSEPVVHIALYHPEIPQNTGNVGRLALAIGARLHLVHPLSFDTSIKAVRRAGLDYWKDVDLVEHADETAFWTWAHGRRVHLFSSHGTRPYTACAYDRGDVLLFGKETVGLPYELVQARGAWRVPMPGPVRSLNLANAVSLVAYEALRRIEPAWFDDPGDVSSPP